MKDGEEEEGTEEGRPLARAIKHRRSMKMILLCKPLIEKIVKHYYKDMKKCQDKSRSFRYLK